MISFEPFYKTLKEKGVTEYSLIYDYGFSSHILHRMKRGQNITVNTIDELCDILKCQVEDIVQCDGVPDYL